MTNADYISRELLLKELNDFSLKISGSANAMALVVMDETKKSIIKVINEQPTAFDLESVIDDFERKLEGTKLRLEVLNIHADKDSLSVKNDILFFKERAERYEEFLEILKFAANAANGKNGG